VILLMRHPFEQCWRERFLAEGTHDRLVPHPWNLLPRFLGRDSFRTRTPTPTPGRRGFVGQIELIEELSGKFGYPSADFGETRREGGKSEIE
jgi:hypothetical protein